LIKKDVYLHYKNKKMVITGIEFNISKVLFIIENDETLNSIFREYCNLSYELLHSMVKDNMITDEIKNTLEEIFIHVISTKEPLYTKYQSLTDEDIKQKKIKLPKHYGKKRILNDIAESDEKSELDLAMLALNDLRNIYSALKNRAIKDKINGTNILDNHACRDIVATVRILENKLNYILKKK
jgi:hypothetical protein